MREAFEKAQAWGEQKLVFKDEGIFADVVSKPRRISLLQGLALCKVGAIHNDTLIVAKFFLHTGNKKIKDSIRSPPSLVCIRHD